MQSQCPECQVYVCRVCEQLAHEKVAGDPKTASQQYGIRRRTKLVLPTTNRLTSDAALAGVWLAGCLFQ